MNKILISLAVCLLLASLTSALDKSQCKCRAASGKRIVGGRIAQSNQYPWHLSIAKMPQLPAPIRRFIPEAVKVGAYHSCGATLLNENWALTAAHCTAAGPLGNINYLGAGADLVYIFDHGRVKAKRFIRHPDYKQGTNDNDIALVELAEPISFSKTVSPACLDKRPAQDYGKSLVITGFGLTSKAYIDEKNPTRNKMGKLSRYLKEADMKDMSNVDDQTSAKCKTQKGMICLLPVTPKDSGCFGDSGSPMHFTENGKTLVVGLTSGTDQFEEEDGYTVVCTGPALYTRVGYYYDFIKQHVGEDNLC